MFGKVLNKLFRRGNAAAAKSAPVVKSAGTAVMPASAAPAPRPVVEPVSSTKGRSTGAPAEMPDRGAATAEGRGADSVKQEWLNKSAKHISGTESAEELCGISKTMPKEEIREKLATLYRRHNRAASSLDARLRDEAEMMLEAIATVKERHLG